MVVKNTKTNWMKLGFEALHKNRWTISSFRLYKNRVRGLWNKFDI